MRARFLTLGSVFAVLAVTAIAQDQPPPQDAENDPPARAARLSYVQGTVSFQPGSVEDWVPATLNRPMTTGDRLWTENGARAEMHIGSAVLRLNGRSNFAFLNLDDRMAQIQLSLGTLSVRVRRLADDENFEIDTPQLALSMLRPGEYRIEVNEAGDTTVVSVRGGEAEATSDGQTFPIKARDQVRVTGVDHQTYDSRDIPPADNFDNWCADRDRREDMSESGRHVSRDIPGYHDLDGNGAWREYPDYGWVWTPRVEVGWAPYHFGHWAWIAPWGWTWVDDAPWGYAPFHYGRWAFIGGGWGWVPGPVVVGVRPVYAPAMVAWVGGGGFAASVGVGVGFGGVGVAVGWFPLAPREVWVPAYRASPAYFNRVNVSNTVVNNVTINNTYNNVYVNRTVNNNNVTYANQNVNGAVSAMPQNAMTRGQPVQQAALNVPRGAVDRAQVSAVPAVAPQREAVTGGGRNYTVSAPPPAITNRQVVARNTPPAGPVPFAQQQQALQRNPGQPLPQASVRQLQQSSPPVRQTFRQVGPAGGGTLPRGGFGQAQGGGQPGGQGGAGNTTTIPRGGFGQGGGQPGGQPAGQPAGQPETLRRGGFGQGNQGGGQPGGQVGGQGGGQPAGQPAGSETIRRGGFGQGNQGGGQPGGQVSGQGGAQPAGQPAERETIRRGVGQGNTGGGQPGGQVGGAQPEVRRPVVTEPRGGQGNQGGGERPQGKQGKQSKEAKEGKREK